MARFPSRSRKGSALVVGLMAMVFLAFMMAVLIQEIVPASRDVRGIENSTVAYYQAQSQIEDALTKLRADDPGHLKSGSGIVTSVAANPTAAVSGGYTISELASSIPQPGDGNSEYDSNWNRIGPGTPVQLWIPASFPLLTQFQLDLRVPKVVTDASVIKPDATNANLTLSGATTDPVVNWTLTNGSNALVPDVTSGSPALFEIGDVNAEKSGSPEFASFAAKDGLDGSGTVASLYASSLGSCASGCTLKLSLATSLQTKGGAALPYLEYRIRKIGPDNTQEWMTYGVDHVTMNGGQFSVPLPSQYADIETVGYAYGFKKDLSRQASQLTTSANLDFAVFQ